MFFAHAVGTAKVALACDGNARVAYLPVKGVGKEGVSLFRVLLLNCRNFRVPAFKNY